MKATPYFFEESHLGGGKTAWFELSLGKGLRLGEGAPTVMTKNMQQGVQSTMMELEKNKNRMNGE